MRPWLDVAYFYSLVAAILAALVIFTVASEFIRGGRVIAHHTGGSLIASMLQLGHRNTRRYGGYVVHIGMALIFIGVLGTPLNRSAEKEMGYGDKIEIGPYTLISRSFTQEETPNYTGDKAIIDVMKGGKQVTTLYPESRLFSATQQPQHLPSVYSPLREDLYVVFEGQNPDTGRPIIKAHLNPLVTWLWIGVLVMLIGTALALFPNAQPVRAAASVPLTAGIPASTAPVGAGD